MNIPQFTAQASLYRPSRRYWSSGSEPKGSPSAQSVVTAYVPGPGTQHDCSACLETCAKTLTLCSAAAAGVAVGGCALSLFTFGISCAGAAALAGTILEGCVASAAACTGYCAIPVVGPCCPKPCGFPGPTGEGCCDADEHCVDQSDPNSRYGCCPSDQSVCGGNCCAKGESCCGDTCCPPNYFCRDGRFCSEYPSDLLPPPGTPPSKKDFSPHSTYCAVGQTPCGDQCCPPGLECCYDVWPYSGVCRTSCGPR